MSGGSDSHASGGAHGKSGGKGVGGTIVPILAGIFTIIVVVGFIASWIGIKTDGGSEVRGGGTAVEVVAPDRVSNSCTGTVHENVTLTGTPISFVGCDVYFDITSGTGNFSGARGSFQVSAGETTGEHGQIDRAWGDGSTTITYMLCPRGSRTQGWRCL